VLILLPDLSLLAKARVGHFKNNLADNKNPTSLMRRVGHLSLDSPAIKPRIYRSVHARALPQQQQRHEHVGMESGIGIESFTALEENSLTPLCSALPIPVD
jgi:hypothetical protein